MEKVSRSGKLLHGWVKMRKDSVQDEFVVDLTR